MADRLGPLRVAFAAGRFAEAAEGYAAPTRDLERFIEQASMEAERA